MQRWAIPLVLVVLLLAGCAQKPAATGADAANASQANVTAAAAAANDDGTKKQTAVDTGAMPHLHDYWKGRERVTLFDGTLEPDQQNATFATLFQMFSRHEAVAGGMLWRLPEGQIVYEGAGVMELTVTYSDPRVTGIAFIYTSADSPDFKQGGTLVPGTAFKLPLTPKMTDMPHAKTSKWNFGFGPDKSPGALLGPFKLKVDIVKVNDISLFPAHPDFWMGKHEITLLDVDHHGAQVSYVKRAAQPIMQGNFTEDIVALAKPVPMETQSLRFNVTITSATSTPGTVTSFGFFVHGADRSDLLRCSIKQTPKFPATVSWTVPVTMEESDSPYDEGSQWRFLVEPQVSITGQDPSGGGTTDVDYTYHVVTTASDAPAEQPDVCRENRGG